ncbi:hypothetical protein [Polluticaenibacter yanchengensis]|uniref:WG repeat-containing protein n=1 Tax=Polluticaenibacter yanchengensis TaxID=3014562 RepID=A0ABT4UKH4_9BACT|nr:hypothetical protein [Chitinophagaceae bacterium LY-5]
MGRIKYIFISITLMFLSQFCLAQAEGVHAKLFFPKKDIALFETDNLGNIYIVNKQQQLIKYSKDLDSLQVYNNVQRFGLLSSIDVSNPLKILLFYKDFSTVVILDRFLAERAAIDFRKIGIYSANAVSLAYDNQVWLYDELNNTIKKINDNNEVSIAFNDFRTLFETAPYPARIIDNNGLVYVYDPKTGILVMDYYGAYKFTLPIKNVQSLNIVNGKVLYIQNNMLHFYSLSELQDKTMILPAEIGKGKNIKIEANKIWYNTDEGIFTINF